VTKKAEKAVKSQKNLAAILPPRSATLVKAL